MILTIDIGLQHPNYELIDNDRIVRKASAPAPTMQDDFEILQEIARYVEATIVSTYNFVSIPLPGEDSYPSTTILASSDWQTASKLLLIIQNASGMETYLLHLLLTRLMCHTAHIGNALNT